MILYHPSVCQVLGRSAYVKLKLYVHKYHYLLEKKKNVKADYQLKGNCFAEMQYLS